MIGWGNAQKLSATIFIMITRTLNLVLFTFLFLASHNLFLVFTIIIMFDFIKPGDNIIILLLF